MTEETRRKLGCSAAIVLAVLAMLLVSAIAPSCMAFYQYQASRYERAKSDVATMRAISLATARTHATATARAALTRTPVPTPSPTPRGTPAHRPWVFP